MKSDIIENSVVTRLENFFGDVGTVIRSLSFALFGLIIFLAYRFFEVQSLFVDYFPDHLTGVNRNLAAYLIAIVFIIPTLLFMSNSDKLKPIIKTKVTRAGFSPAVVMAWITFLINLFFWRVWEGTFDRVLFKLMISVITAYLDYTFSELFNKKFQDWLKNSSIHQSIYALEQKLTKVKQDIKEALQKVNEYNQKQTDRKQELSRINQEIRAKKKALERFACPYCVEYVGETQNGLNKHLGGCKKRHGEKGG